MQHDRKLDALKQYFGYTSFRPGQEEIVDCLCSGRDALCVMPTGGGKSICYQLPALLSDGVALIISPLISLMADQVAALKTAGIRAAYVNSTLTSEQYFKVEANIANLIYRLVYVAPERLDSDSFIALCQKIKISLIAVDEAHCVSQWGQDFRPSYLRIADFINKLPRRPTVAAFTATATVAVREDIIRLLDLINPHLTVTGFDRPNLRFTVLNCRESEKENRLLGLIRSRQGQSGIVYCSSRRAVEKLCDMLNNSDISTTRYHAGLDPEERKANQDDFIYDRRQVMTATNAFGMGIDKSNVSYVIHYNMPKDIESYYQEAGRAGRDGSDADCILLFSPRDIKSALWMIDNPEENPELSEEQKKIIRDLTIKRLNRMVGYCRTDGCLRTYMLRYFGENASGSCGNCSNCSGSPALRRDITIDAQKVLCCVIRTGERYGINMIADVLLGRSTERLLELGFDSLSTYGIMKDSSEQHIKKVIDALTARGYAEISGEYPILRLTETSPDIIYGRDKLTMVVREPEKKAAAGKKSSNDKTEAENKQLFNALRVLRREISDRLGVPAYVVFSDATIIDMCNRMPSNHSEFLKVSGVGENKCSRYADAFIKVIDLYRN